MMRKKFQSSGELVTSIECEDGAEREVRAGWEATPPEPENGWPGSVELTYVVLMNPPQVDIIDNCSDEEIDHLTREVQEHLDSTNDPDALGDYLYDLRKDERL